MPLVQMAGAARPAMVIECRRVQCMLRDPIDEIPFVPSKVKLQ